MSRGHTVGLSAALPARARRPRPPPHLHMQQRMPSLAERPQSDHRTHAALARHAAILYYTVSSRIEQDGRGRRALLHQDKVQDDAERDDKKQDRAHEPVVLGLFDELLEPRLLRDQGLLCLVDARLEVI